MADYPMKFNGGLDLQAPDGAKVNGSPIVTDATLPATPLQGYEFIGQETFNLSFNGWVASPTEWFTGRANEILLFKLTWSTSSPSLSYYAGFFELTHNGGMANTLADVFSYPLQGGGSYGEKVTGAINSKVSSDERPTFLYNGRAGFSNNVTAPLVTLEVFRKVLP